MTSLWLNLLTPRVGVHPCNLLFPLSNLLGTEVLTQCFSSLATQLCVDLSYSLGCIGVLLPVFI